MDEPAAEGRPRKAEQRRDRRFPVVVPVEAEWQEPGGRSVREVVEAKEVNAQGGLLEMKSCPSVGSQIELTNLLSGEAFRARVVGIRRLKDGRLSGVAVELLIPSETFWGVNFRLKKTGAELVRLERAMKSGSVDPRILREFRDAVDYVRKTAWAVQEWQERELQAHNPRTLLPFIASERIRRATQLSKTILGDLTSHEVGRETPGIDEFFRAVENLYESLEDVIGNREA